MNKLALVSALSWMAVMTSVVSLPGCAGEAAPPIDQSFISFWAVAKDQSFAEQEMLWNKFIEDPREAVYQSVVWEVGHNPDWKQGKERALKDRFGQYRSMGKDIPGGVRTIGEALNVQVKRFTQYFGTSWQPRVMVVLAPNFDAKSGVLPDGEPVLVLAIDTLLIEKPSLDILLPHELFHLWDAERSGITNDGVMPDTHLLLPLFEEGLATYVSSVVSPGHSDGEYLLQADLGALPEATLPGAAKRFLADSDEMTIDPARHQISTAYERWFQSGRVQRQAGLPNRSGYWLGLHTIRILTRNHTL